MSVHTYVLTSDLYNEVKDEIPKHIGVYVGGDLIKKAKKQKLSIDEQILKDSMIRSLYRESEKILRSEEPTVVESLNRQVNYQRGLYKEYYDKYWDLLRKIQNKYGYDWDKKQT